MDHSIFLRLITQQCLAILHAVGRVLTIMTDPHIISPKQSILSSSRTRWVTAGALILAAASFCTQTRKVSQEGNAKPASSITTNDKPGTPNPGSNTRAEGVERPTSNISVPADTSARDPKLSPLNVSMLACGIVRVYVDSEEGMKAMEDADISVKLVFLDQFNQRSDETQNPSSYTVKVENGVLEFGTLPGSMAVELEFSISTSSGAEPRLGRHLVRCRPRRIDNLPSLVDDMGRIILPQVNITLEKTDLKFTIRPDKFYALSTRSRLGFVAQVSDDQRSVDRAEIFTFDLHNPVSTSGNASLALIREGEGGESLPVDLKVMNFYGEIINEDGIDDDLAIHSVAGRLPNHDGELDGKTFSLLLRPKVTNDIEVVVKEGRLLPARFVLLRIEDKLSEEEVSRLALYDKTHRRLLTRFEPYTEEGDRATLAYHQTVHSYPTVGDLPKVCLLVCPENIRGMIEPDNACSMRVGVVDLDLGVIQLQSLGDGVVGNEYKGQQGRYFSARYLQGIVTTEQIKSVRDIELHSGTEEEVLEQLARRL